MARQVCTLSIDPDIYSLFIQKYRGRVSSLISQYMKDMLNIEDFTDEQSVDEIERREAEINRKMQQLRIEKKANDIQKFETIKNQAQKEKELAVLQAKQQKLKVEDFELYNSLDGHDQMKIKIAHLEAIKSGAISNEVTVSDYYVNIYSKEEHS